MSTTDTHRDLLRFLARLGQAELVAGNAAALIERDLGLIAKRNGVEHITISVLPTVMFIQFDDGNEQAMRMALGPYRAGSLRFDQIEGVLQIARDARNGSLSPREGLRKLEAVWRMKHRYGDLGFVFGYLLMTVGVGLVLRPTWSAMGVVALLGLLCALMLVVVRSRPAWNAVMPVVAAFVLSAAVGVAYRMGVTASAMDLLIPPLIVFLPGSVLTVAIVELAFANTVSGATRLVAGFTQLVLLAFGLLGGFRTFHHVERMLPLEDPVRLGWWGPWLGVLLFATGLHLNRSSRARSFIWMLITMVMAYIGQQAAGVFLPGASSAFFGAALMMWTALAIEHRLKGPPALITFLPAFWLLAPGAFGLMSVTGMANDPGTAANLITLLFTLTAIAMGCLLGAFAHGAMVAGSRTKWWRRDPLVRSERLDPPDRTAEG